MFSICLLPLQPATTLHWGLQSSLDWLRASWKRIAAVESPLHPSTAEDVDVTVMHLCYGDYRHLPRSPHEEGCHRADWELSRSCFQIVTSAISCFSSPLSEILLLCFPSFSPGGQFPKKKLEWFGSKKGKKLLSCPCFIGLVIPALCFSDLSPGGHLLKELELCNTETAKASIRVNLEVVMTAPATLTPRYATEKKKKALAKHQVDGERDPGACQ